MVTPTGSPAWTKTADHTFYGGHLQKINYQSQGAVNSRTDLTAENLCRIAADLAAVVRTAPFATVLYTCNDTGAAAPTIDVYSAMSGTAPTGARVGDGSVTLTWSASYSDEHSVSGDLHIIGAIATVVDSSSYFASVALSDPDVNGLNERVTVSVFDDAGAAVVDPQVSLVIFTGPA